jgi:hypothetical protein
MQVMRKRLLKSLGFKVVNLRLQNLVEARGDHDILAEYIQKKMNESS